MTIAAHPPTFPSLSRQVVLGARSRTGRSHARLARRFGCADEELARISPAAPSSSTCPRSSPPESELKFLLAAMRIRDIRVAGLEGAAPAVLDADMPQALLGAKPDSGPDLSDLEAISPNSDAAQAAPASTLTIANSLPGPGSPCSPTVTLRFSGRSLPARDRGGRVIHIYGSLRGRAVAGCTGNSSKPISAASRRPELVAIDGLYKTADDLGSKFRKLPIQASLDGDSLILTPLD